MSLQKQKNKASDNQLVTVLDRPFDLNNREDVDYLNNLKNTYSASVGKSDEEGNETDRSLSNQLILITTVLITANIVVFGNKDLLTTLTYAHKTLLLLGLWLLMLSLHWGIQYYKKVKIFHSRWADAKQSIAAMASNVTVGTYGELRKNISLAYSGLGAHIDEKYLNRQITAIRLALAIYLLFAILLLFSFTFVTRHLSWYK